MPRCIFCDRDVPHAISKARPERSLCLDCLVEVKRFETQNMEEILRKLYPDHVVEAIRRLRNANPAATLSQEQQAQLLRDAYTAREALHF